MYCKADLDTQGKMKQAFTFLLDVSVGKNPKIPANFIKTFSFIALFMESDEFHTSAEVLGGMHATAVTLANVENLGSEPSDLKVMQKGFKNILEFYKNNLSVF